ncbi:MAG: hypothetical protein ACRD04_06105 [Terriglobales bacterium]
MAVPVLEAIADAIMAFEGWKVGSRSYRNRNPGNLRAATLPHEMDAGGYCVFQSMVTGYQALLRDLRAKVTGQNTHGLNADSSLLDLMSVYAPALNFNSPMMYAAFIAAWLSDVYAPWEFGTLHTISAVFHYADQELPVGQSGS